MTSTRPSFSLAQSYIFMMALVSAGHSTIRGWPVQPLPPQKLPLLSDRPLVELTQ